ncbi:MAG: hypothetical protein ISN26_06340 [Betaproteobacteria bacterium AqS2]|uniref:Uncharacterized protein n=1 Tax=Candidatus Amphirhobacter heronislandensis TaxID=1732024 RepID=A0A930UH54_9GAMM|nr:hypothetical protein [Betaproteobacteria bacterium AqS2]
MARADLPTDLVRFALAGDKVRFRKVVEAIVAEERAKRHTFLANKLEGLLGAMPADRSAPNGAGAVLEQ